MRPQQGWCTTGSSWGCPPHVAVNILSTDSRLGKDKALMLMLPWSMSIITSSGQTYSSDRAHVRTTRPIHCFKSGLKATIMPSLGGMEAECGWSQLLLPWRSARSGRPGCCPGNHGSASCGCWWMWRPCSASHCRQRRVHGPAGTWSWPCVARCNMCRGRLSWHAPPRSRCCSAPYGWAVQPCSGWWCSLGTAHLWHYDTDAPAHPLECLITTPPPWQQGLLMCLLS